MKPKECHRTCFHFCIPHWEIPRNWEDHGTVNLGLVITTNIYIYTNAEKWVDFFMVEIVIMSINISCLTSV